jgi:hypothetical protein
MGRRGKPLNRTLEVFFGDAFQIDGSRLNSCIRNLTGGKMGIPWAGNVLVMRPEEPLYRSERWHDATMEDLAPMTRFFQEYNDEEGIKAFL